MSLVGVVFQSGGKVELFDAAGLEPAWNQRVICETARGEAYGRVVQAPHDGVAPDPLFRVLRIATPEDEARRREQRELGRRLGLRVEARQMGPRDGARITGGYGLCGDVLCCTRFPAHEKRITLRMAKDQELPVNPGRVTGLCGRLRCCLAFEHPLYRSFRDRAPAVGQTVDTPEGRGVVRGVRVPEDAVLVRLADDREVPIRLDDLTVVGR